MYGHLASQTHMSSVCPKSGSFLALLEMILIPLKPVGRYVQVEKFIFCVFCSKGETCFFCSIFPVLTGKMFLVKLNTFLEAWSKLNFVPQK